METFHRLLLFLYYLYSHRKFVKNCFYKSRLKDLSGISHFWVEICPKNMVELTPPCSVLWFIVTFHWHNGSYICIFYSLTLTKNIYLRFSYITLFSWYATKAKISTITIFVGLEYVWLTIHIHNQVQQNQCRISHYRGQLHSPFVAWLIKIHRETKVTVIWAREHGVVLQVQVKSTDVMWINENRQ